MEICGRGGRMLGGAGRTKEWNDKGRQKWRDTLDKESPIQAGCIKVHVRICAGGAGQLASLPRPMIKHQIGSFSWEAGLIRSQLRPGNWALIRLILCFFTPHANEIQ